MIAPGEMTAVRGRAEELRTYAAALDEAAFFESSRRFRIAADDLMRALDTIDAERSARVAMQEARDRLIAIITSRATPSTENEVRA